jgi:hypothetical protein
MDQIERIQIRLPAVLHPCGVAWSALRRVFIHNQKWFVEPVRGHIAEHPAIFIQSCPNSWVLVTGLGSNGAAEGMPKGSNVVDIDLSKPWAARIRIFGGQIVQSQNVIPCLNMHFRIADGNLLGDGSVLEIGDVVDIRGINYATVRKCYRRRIIRVVDGGNDKSVTGQVFCLVGVLCAATSMQD